MDAFSVGAGAGTAGADRTGPSARAPAAAREAGFRHHLARQEGMCAVDAGIDDHHSLAKPAIACGPREVALDLRHRLRQRRHVRPILGQGEDGGIGGEGVDLVRRGFNRHEGQLLEAVPGLQEGVRQPCLQGRPDTGDVVPLLHGLGHGQGGFRREWHPEPDEQPHAAGRRGLSSQSVQHRCSRGVGVQRGGAPLRGKQPARCR